MARKVPLTCRLCMKAIEGDNYEQIKEIEREILEVLLIEIDLSISKQPVICNECEEQLQHCFSFKATCLYTEDYVVPLVDPNNDNKIDLKEIFVKQFKVEEEMLGVKICRFCMKITEHFITLDNINEKIFKKDMLQKFIPELDLTSVDECVSCDLCLKSLEKALGFLNRCLASEKIIKKNCKSNGENKRGLADLAHVLQHSLDVQKPNEDTQSDVILDFGNLSNDEGLQDLDNDEYEKECANLEKVEIKAESVQEFKSSLQQNRKHKYFSQKGFKRKRKYTNANHKCQVCGFVSPYSSVVKTHMLLHKDSSEIIMYKCDKCTFETKYRGSLVSHKLIHDKSEAAKKYECSVCNYRSKGLSLLKKHMLQHMNPCDVPMYKCDICPFETKYRESLRYHKVIHQNCELLKCTLCSYETKHKRTLDAHMICHKDTSEIIMYKCDECIYESKTKTGLNRHMITHKNLEKSLKCGLCSFSTAKKQNLISHMSTHTLPEVTYRCAQCGFKTRHKHSLIRHEVCHKSASEMMTYKCNNCAFVTKYKSSMKQHTIGHKDASEVIMYNCTVCDFKTKRRTTLKQHELTHVDLSEVEGYSCDKCNFQSRHRTSLINHLVLHVDQSKVTMHKCSLCNYQTRHKRDISWHMKLHHKGAEKL